MSGPNATFFRAALLQWFRRQKRALPWRQTSDPYAIWISEVMLQQTRVETVIPYYVRFLARFPTVRALASAHEDEVLSLWAGLGYYSRARNLHAAAQLLARKSAGQMPRDANELRALPGIGRYTAGAIASIAFGQREPVVDGNVSRVLARIYADAAPRLVQWQRAADLLPRSRPGDFNQALMELGATVCTARAPRCADCPVAQHCNACQTKQVQDFPQKVRRKNPRRVQSVCAIVQRKSQWLMVKQPSRGLLGGLWGWPSWEISVRSSALHRAAFGLEDEFGLEVGSGATRRSLRHEFTHLWLDVVPAHFEWRGGTPRKGSYAQVKFVDGRKIGELALSKLARKVFERVCDHVHDHV